MPKKSEALAQKQAKIRPKLEDVVATSLGDEAQQCILEFLEYCKSKKVAYYWSSTNRWNMKTKGKSIGYIGIGGKRRGNTDGSWYIDLDLRELHQYEDILEKEDVSEIVQKYLRLCNYCGSCSPGMNVMLFEKEIHNVCYSMFVYIENPDTDLLKGIQKLVNIRLAIPHGTAIRPLLDTATDGLTRINNKRHVSRVLDMDINTSANICTLFDGKYVKYYYIGPYGDFKTNESSHDIIIELDKRTRVVMYSLVTSMRPNVPNSWTLYGARSLTGSWKRLDVQLEFPKPVTCYTEKAFKIASPAAYKYYRITFEGTQFVLSQIHLYR